MGIARVREIDRSLGAAVMGVKGGAHSRGILQILVIAAASVHDDDIDVSMPLTA